MNPDNLTRQAIRLAQRESRKRGRVLSREEVLRLSVQTMDPWKRAFVAAWGLPGLGLAWLGQHHGALWWFWAPCGLAGVAVLILGAVGRKSYLDRELQKLAREGPTRVLDAVLNALP